MGTRKKDGRGLLAALAAAGLVLAVLAPAAGVAGDLDEMLTEVGGQYAEGYLAPLGTSFGVNQNSGLFQTAAIPVGRLTISFGVQAMGSRIAEEDQTFRRVVTMTLDETVGVQPTDPGYGEQGVLVMTGPTVFGPDGDEDAGTIRAYYAGLPVGEAAGISGLKKMRTIPLFMPQASIGGIAGFRATVRWLPPIDFGDLGTLKLWGFGLAYNVTQFVPTLPFDGMVGFFNQRLDLGDAIQTKATSVYLAASKTFTALTIYGSAAWESSTLDVSYIFEPAAGESRSVSFSMDGKQDSRVTVGACLDLGMRLSAEMSTGTLTAFSAGLMFGF